MDQDGGGLVIVEEEELGGGIGVEVKAGGSAPRVVT